MTNILKVLEERGLVKQVTHPEPLAQQLERPTTVYAGFDATADSLHVGHLLPVMILVHLQRAGHRPIVLLGGGTSLIGDPSGKTEMRRMLAEEEIQANCQKIAAQLRRFLVLDGQQGLVLNNADWLRDVNYIEFLRDVGVHFSVNRMLTYECFKSRMERGLSFLEFNYMLLQSYDFLTLFRNHDCRLQVGGDDQWSNIISGIDLIRRTEQHQVFGLTAPLLATADGKKMGKTEGGAVWLDGDKFSPYEFFQFWRNTHDQDVRRFLQLFTLLPMAEIDQLTAQGGQALNEAKEVLAYTVTTLVHGREQAENARQAARALFAGQGQEGAIPTTEIATARLEQGIGILDLLRECGLTASNGEGRRLIQQGGIYLNGQRVADPDLVIRADDIVQGKLSLRKGKKIHHRVLAR